MFLIAEMCFSVYSYYGDQDAFRQKHAVQVAAEMERNEYLGQAKPFEKLDQGKYTVLTVLSNNLTLVKLNLPTGDITLLVYGLPDNVLEKRYFSKLHGGIVV